MKPKLRNKNRKYRLDFGKFIQEYAYLTSRARERKIKLNIFIKDESIIEISPKYNPQNCLYRTESRYQVTILEKQKFPKRIMVAREFLRLTYLNYILLKIMRKLIKNIIKKKYYPYILKERKVVYLNEKNSSLSNKREHMLTLQNVKMKI